MKPTNFDLALARASNRTRARQEAQEALDLAKHREHVAKVLLDPRKAMNNYKRQQATRRENLLDPDWGTVRYFPKWSFGMTTREYIRSYQALNRKTSNAPELTFTHADRLAPMNLPWESGL
jgi:hypothetical protein